MPEWLTDSFTSDPTLGLEALATRIGAAFLLGCLVAGVYRLTRRPLSNDAPSLVPTLVLLTVLISIITLVIGNSVARAFSLVGALAIVRFRTVVEDTRDTAFVIFAVGIGMAAGTGARDEILIGVPIASVAALLFRRSGKSESADRQVYLLTVRVGVGPNPDVGLHESLLKHFRTYRLVTTATARQGAALDLTYAGPLRAPETAAGLVAEMNGLPGVQSVEFREK